MGKASGRGLRIISVVIGNRLRNCTLTFIFAHEDIHQHHRPMNDRAHPILRDAFERFAIACRENPTDRGYFNFAEPQFRRLTEEVSLTLPAYDRAAAGWDARSQMHIRRIRAGRDLQAFLRHTNAFNSIHSAQFSAVRAAEDFEQEVARELCRMTQRFVLDGFELTSPELAFSRGRFVKLTESTFGDISGYAPTSCDRRIGLHVLELQWRSPNPPWETGVFDDAESPHNRIQRLAHPWIDFMNLWARGKVRIAGVFEWTDSALCPTRHYLDDGEPVWQDNYKHNEEEDVDEWVSESPRRTLIVSDETQFVRFLERLADGFEESGPEAHRADIAMRYFRRVVDNFWTHHIGGDGTSQDPNEDIIVDSMTALETIFLANEKRDKGGLMAARAAAIIEDTDVKRRDVRKRIQSLYKLRSVILHGDLRPSASELKAAAVDAEEFARRCLSAFLLAGGDRQAFLRAATDLSIAAELRRKIAL